MQVKSRQEEFAELYEESFSLVYNYMYSRTLDAALTEDVCAEAYTKAWRNFAKFDPSRAKFSTWVITIARNVLTSHFRVMRDTTPVDDVAESLFATADNDSLLTNDQVEGLLSTLTEEERELVNLRYWQEMSPTQISEITGMNASTVRTKLHRAVEHMRRAMK